MVKNFVIDTNMLMTNPDILFSFKENRVYIVGTVLQELDKHKSDLGERGYNAREAIKMIQQLMAKTLADCKDENEMNDILTNRGIPLNDEGGLLLFEPDGVDIDYLPKGFTLDRADNKIISSCLHMNRQYCKNNKVTLLTEDAGMFVNSAICGIHVENVRSEHIEYTGYSGHVNIEIENWALIDKIHKSGCINIKEVKEIGKLDYPLFENQFVTLMSGTSAALTVYQKNELHKIDDQILDSYNIRPMNKMQRYAMWALTNPNIPLVILEGPAGTAKTFLSLACGLSQLDVRSAYGKDSYMGDREYEAYSRILISRPNNKTSDADFGYLPGTLEEKMGPLVASYMDNLEQILGDNATPIKDTRQTIEDMMYSRLIELCPLYAIRGRSINNAYLICDEAQNASKKLIKDVVTRAGKNTKIIVAGDPSQIDNTLLSLHNNGLLYLKDCMKGSPNCAIVRFEKDHCVRSVLAEDAINRMK